MLGALFCQRRREQRRSKTQEKQDTGSNKQETIDRWAHSPPPLNHLIILAVSVFFPGEGDGAGHGPSSALLGGGQPAGPGGGGGSLGHGEGEQHGALVLEPLPAAPVAVSAGRGPCGQDEGGQRRGEEEDLGGTCVPLGVKGRRGLGFCSGQTDHLGVSFVLLFFARDAFVRLLASCASICFIHSMRALSLSLLLGACV